MCVPVLGALGALASIGSSMAGFAAAQQQADAQNQYYYENAMAAQSATRNSYVNLNIRSDQTRASAVGQATEDAIDAMQKRGTAQVSASEAGVSGLSVDALINDIYAQEGRRLGGLQQQHHADQMAVRSQFDDVWAQGQRQINSVQRATPPSPASFIIQGISGAIGAIGRSGAQGMGTA